MHTHNPCCYETKEGTHPETPEQRIAAARAIWNDRRAVPIADHGAGRVTSAWHYLTDARGPPLRNLNPEVARFHPAVRLKQSGPAKPALVFACRDQHGKVAGVQCVFLVQRKDGRVERTDKLSRGIVRGNPVLIPPAPHNTLVLACEGPEDALSLQLATGGACYATLSSQNLRHLPLDHGEKVVVFLDRLPGELTDDARAVEAVARELDLLCDRGVEVWTALPPPDCKDANDTLRAHGRDALGAAAEAATRYVPRPADTVAAPQECPAGSEVVAPQASGRAAHHARARDRRYALGALRGECAAVRRAPWGAQEQTLNLAAFRIGQRVGAGLLSQAEALTELVAAGMAMRGQPGKPPWSANEVRRKVENGLAHGAQHPRDPRKGAQ